MLPDSIIMLDVIYYTNKINKLPTNINKIRINEKYKQELLLFKPNIQILN